MGTFLKLFKKAVFILFLLFFASCVTTQSKVNLFPEELYMLKDICNYTFLYQQYPHLEKEITAREYRELPSYLQPLYKRNYDNE